MLQTITLTPAATPLATLIVLHGLGADGTDFLPMCDELDLAAIGPVRCVMPRAPTRPVTINGGMPMRAWYDILGAELGSPGEPDLSEAFGAIPQTGAAGGGRPGAGARREDETGLRQSMRDVHALLDAEVALGVPAHRIVLAGFSQGCAMTLLAGLRYPQRLAGLVCMSGYLPLAGTTATERHAANRDVPLFMAHGRNDDMVPLARGKASCAALQALGHEVEWHDYPMAHSVSMEEITHLNRWLLRVLA